jgi:hypothetical protein
MDEKISPLGAELANSLNIIIQLNWTIHFVMFTGKKSISN